MIDTVIFDLDGTLLNTLDDLMDSVNYALKECGFKERTYAEIRAFVGNGVRLLIERALPFGVSAEQTERCFQLFTKHYDKNMNNKTRPYDGIEAALKAVKDRGLKTAVVSNKYDSAVKELVFSLFGEFIDEAVGESENVKKKPAPDGVEAALRSLGSQKAAAVYVGDSDVDALTARNSCLKFIGVTWGFRDREVLESLGAEIIIDSPPQLISALDSLGAAMEMSLS